MRFRQPTRFFVERFGLDPRYGHNVPTGWIKIVFDLLTDLKQMDPNIQIIQVKSKFAGLRVYYKSEKIDDLHPVIVKAETDCAKTCEECGADHKIDKVRIRGFGFSGGWMVTSCRSCYIDDCRRNNREPQEDLPQEENE